MEMGWKSSPRSPQATWLSSKEVRVPEKGLTGTESVSKNSGETVQNALTTYHKGNLFTGAYRDRISGYHIQAGRFDVSGAEEDYYKQAGDLVHRILAIV